MVSILAITGSLPERTVSLKEIDLFQGKKSITLNVPTLAALQSHPKLGASWEGFALEQIVAWVGERNAYFWAIHGGAELDLLVHANGKRWGFEFKHQDAPKMTKLLHTALVGLQLERAWVIYPGTASYSLQEQVECLGLREIAKLKLLIL